MQPTEQSKTSKIKCDANVIKLKYAETKLALKQFTLLSKIIIWCHLRTGIKTINDKRIALCIIFN